MTGAWGVDIYVLQTCRIAEEVEGCEVLAGCHSDSILMSSSRAEMSSMSSIAITRLGRLNRRASRNSVMAVRARKSMVLNMVFTLNLEI